MMKSKILTVLFISLILSLLPFASAELYNKPKDSMTRLKFVGKGITGRQITPPVSDMPPHMPPKDFDIPLSVWDRIDTAENAKKAKTPTPGKKNTAREQNYNAPIFDADPTYLPFQYTPPPKATGEITRNIVHHQPSLGYIVKTGGRLVFVAK